MNFDSKEELAKTMMHFENIEREYIEEVAIKYGFSSVTECSTIMFHEIILYVSNNNNEFIKYNDYNEIFKNLDKKQNKYFLPGFLKICHKKREEYFKVFDNAMHGYYANNSEKQILRKAHFYYTSRDEEMVINEKIKKSSEFNKYKTARKNIEKLFNEASFFQEDYDDILYRIDSAIDILITSRAKMRSINQMKMHLEFDKLKISNNKRKDIVSSFFKSF